MVEVVRRSFARHDRGAGRRFNQTIKADEANYREAQALIAEARAQLFPTLSFDPSLTRASQLGVTTTTLSAEPSAAWTLDLWGKVRRTIESQVAGAQVSAADLANATLSMQSSLAAAYYELRETDSLRDLLADTVAQYQRSLTITQNQYNAGVAAQSDVITARALVLAAQAQEISTGVSRAQFEHAIAVLMGARRRGCRSRTASSRRAFPPRRCVCRRRCSSDGPTSRRPSAR